VVADRVVPSADDESPAITMLMARWQLATPSWSQKRLNLINCRSEDLSRAHPSPFGCAVLSLDRIVSSGEECHRRLIVSIPLCSAIMHPPSLFQHAGFCLTNTDASCVSPVITSGKPKANHTWCIWYRSVAAVPVVHGEVMWI
jgi:hypothetical protein